MKIKKLFGDSKMWQSTLSGFLATVLGILVTIGASHWQEELGKKTIDKLQKEADEDLHTSLILSDILIGTNEFSTMAYHEDGTDRQFLWRFVRTKKE